MAIEFDVRYFHAILVRVQDTNNLKLDIECLGLVIKNKKVRLHGVIMPAWRSNEKKKKNAADLCMKEIKKYLRQNKRYVIRVYGKERMSCDIYPEELQGKSLNQHLLDSGFAMHHYIKEINL